MERGSVIDAQVEKEECVQEEVRKCGKSQRYFYLNYFLVNGKPPVFISQTDWENTIKNLMKRYHVPR